MANSLTTNKRDFYSWIAPVYEPLVGPFLYPLRKRVCRVAGEIRCGRFLDIACGTGMQVRMLAESGVTAVGVDLSPAMLSKALAMGRQGSFYSLADGGNLPFLPESFDCALISLAAHEMDYSTAVRVVKEALRVLTAKGKLLLFDYVPGRDFLSLSSLAALHIVERMAGRRHFRNFRHFIERGGLEAFIEQFPLKVVSSREFFGGSTRLIVTERVIDKEESGQNNRRRFSFCQ